jgi:hypothetical protein
MLTDIILILPLVIFAVVVWGFLFLGVMLLVFKIYNSPMFISDRKKRCGHNDD